MEFVQVYESSPRCEAARLVNLCSNDWSLCFVWNSTQQSILSAPPEKVRPKRRRESHSMAAGLEFTPAPPQRQTVLLPTLHTPGESVEDMMWWVCSRHGLVSPWKTRWRESWPYRWPSNSILLLTSVPFINVHNMITCPWYTFRTLSEQRQFIDIQLAIVK